MVKTGPKKRSNVYSDIGQMEIYSQLDTTLENLEVLYVLSVSFSFVFVRTVTETALLANKGLLHDNAKPCMHCITTQ